MIQLKNGHKKRKDDKKRWSKYTEILNQEDMCITRKRIKKLLQQKDYRKVTKFSRKMRIVIKMRKISQKERNTKEKVRQKEKNTQ